MNPIQVAQFQALMAQQGVMLACGLPQPAHCEASLRNIPAVGGRPAKVAIPLQRLPPSMWILLRQPTNCAFVMTLLTSISLGLSSLGQRRTGAHTFPNYYSCDKELNRPPTMPSSLDPCHPKRLDWNSLTCLFFKKVSTQHFWLRWHTEIKICPSHNISYWPYAWIISATNSSRVSSHNHPPSSQGHISSWTFSCGRTGASSFNHLQTLSY